MLSLYFIYILFNYTFLIVIYCHLYYITHFSVIFFISFLEFQKGCKLHFIVKKYMHQKELSYNYETRRQYSVRVNNQMIKNWNEKKHFIYE